MVQMDTTKPYKNKNDVELRKLSPGCIFKLSQLLEIQEGWKELMSVIPVECKEDNPLKYTHEHMLLIQSAGMCQKRPFTEILLEEWGTSGKNRPTVSFLLQCLLKAQLYKAAEFVAVELLNEPSPPRPETGPAAPVKYPSTAILLPAELTPSAPPNLSASSLYEPSAPPASSTMLTTELVQSDTSNQSVAQISFNVLETATGRFSEAKLLGGGAGGSVYFAHLHPFGALAIKKLHESESPVGSPFDPQLQFNNEVELLAKLTHPNLLPLVGYSDDGPALCIVYRFMNNGSLLDKLALKTTHSTLPWRLRVEIALGAARGLDYLHSYSPKPFVHRDVKSANILLDDNFTPKLGDFGLARHGSSGSRTFSAAVTKNAAGTSAYMAPEAHRGDVSVKLDVYSFGVVILELLTSLPPYDETREGHDLVTFVEDTNDNESLLDMSAGEWPKDVATQLFHLANLCLREKKRDRPFIPEVIDKLEMCLT